MQDTAKNVFLDPRYSLISELKKKKKNQMYAFRARRKASLGEEEEVTAEAVTPPRKYD